MINDLVISKPCVSRCSSIPRIGVLMKRNKGGGAGTHFKTEPENHLMLVNMTWACNGLNQVEVTALAHNGQTYVKWVVICTDKSHRFVQWVTTCFLSLRISTSRILKNERYWSILQDPTARQSSRKMDRTGLQGI